MSAPQRFAQGIAGTVAIIIGVALLPVFERRIFRPLGMRDTLFIVSREKRTRRAGLCGFDAEGQLTALTTAPGGHALGERPDDMTFESGGQGLWSTLDDWDPASVLGHGCESQRSAAMSPPAS